MIKEECIICGEEAKETYKGYKVCSDEDCKIVIDEKIRIGVLEG